MSLRPKAERSGWERKTNQTRMRKGGGIRAELKHNTQSIDTGRLMKIAPS